MLKELDFVMMVGLPCSGKSTYIENNLEDYVAISTDNIIQTYADYNGKSYNDVFKEYIKTAEKIMNWQLMNAILNRKNIVWDQTNLTRKTRAKKLSRIPSDLYIKRCVSFEVPDDVGVLFQAQLDHRPEKVISPQILEGMRDTYEEPMIDEGFATISHEKLWTGAL